MWNEVVLSWYLPGVMEEFHKNPQFIKHMFFVVTCEVLSEIIWDELERISDGLFMTCFKILTLYLPERDKEDHLGS
jgi:hypothetical protein